jgi:Protein of unknown function (DUF1501)
MEHPLISRRQLLQMSGLGIGNMAFAYLLHAENRTRLGTDLRTKPGHFPAKATSIIQLVQNGGPSQMDLFDPKPELQKRSGQRYGEKVEMFQPGSEANQLMASPFEFKPRGRCGMQLSEVLTHTSTVADDMCLIRSMFSEHNNHLEALVMLQTGKIFPGRPTLGAWISYGLGTENQDLPAYIVLRDPEGYNTSGPLLWENGWLPALYRGTEFNSQGTPVLNLHPSVPIPKGVEQDNLSFLAKLNEAHRVRYPFDSDLEARIRNYELAARMQLSADKALDLSKESEPTKKLYGLDNSTTAGYGMRCLMARRLVESGVRFVQVFPPIKPSVQPWDSHGNIYKELREICAKTEVPVAGLIRDLKSRGLLETTIVMWAGEFGRLPVSQNSSGRDHNRNAFSLWLAGGGFRAGYVHGATDDFGYRATENRVSVPDLHATILQQLGIDHRKLVYQHHGREETLTDFPATGAKVVSELLASTGVA